MKLNELLKVIDYSYDFTDTEWDTTFYVDAVDNKYTRQIEVFRITPSYVVCNFSKFIDKHKKLIRDKLYEYYAPQWASHYAKLLDNPRLDEDDYCEIIINGVMSGLLEEEDE